MSNNAKATAHKKKKEPKPVIPAAMLPMAGITEVKTADGTYLQRNDVWFTAMKHSQGEFSHFFLALRDEGKVVGNRCPQCKQLIVPPFMTRCPTCNFVEMKKEYLKDTGVMCASPVITVFAPAASRDRSRLAPAECSWRRLTAS